jgi:tRNA nucleotidyltransferase (CCA-adding enzyme)
MCENLANAKDVLIELKRHGFEAFIVGGFVRDRLLGINSDDIDITTSATPNEIESLFKRVKQTGKKFGGVTVFMGNFKYEVTTFRKEMEYLQHRFPSSITFSKKVKEDVIRRDFTINALLMDEQEKIIDYVHGMDDLSNHILRAIGEPKTRFYEDALRILRAFRFQSKLGFRLDVRTLEAIKEHRNLVETISIERVIQELNKTIQGDYYQTAFQSMVTTGVHECMFGLKEGIAYCSLINEKITPIEFYIVSNILGKISKKLRFSNKDKLLIEKVTSLHYITKDDVFNNYIVFANKLEVCLQTNRINVLLGYPDQEELIRQLWEKLPVKDVCELAFKGQDIIKLTHLKKRSDIGLILDDLLVEVLHNKLDNKYDILKEFALKRIEELEEKTGDDHE